MKVISLATKMLLALALVLAQAERQGSSSMVAAQKRNVRLPRAAQARETWTNVAPIGETFSVEMPKRPEREQLLPRNPTGARGYIYSLTNEGISYTVLSLDSLPGWLDNSRGTDPEESLRQLVNGGNVNINFQREQALAKYSGRQYPITTPNGDSGLMRVYLTRQRVYVMVALGTILDSTSMKRFLDSFRLIEAVPTADFPVYSRNQPSRRDSSVFSQGASSPASRPAQICTCRYDEDRDAEICYQPELAFVTSELELHPTGRIQLTVQLIEDGRVIVDVNSVRTEGNLPYGLAQRAIDAARQIKFCPAVRDGKKVSQGMTIFYEVK